METYTVTVRDIDTQELVKSIKDIKNLPRAERIEDGISINLDHTKFITDIEIVEDNELLILQHKVAEADTIISLIGIHQDRSKTHITSGTHALMVDYTKTYLKVPFRTVESPITTAILDKKIYINNPSAWTSFSQEGSDHLEDLLKAVEGK